MRIRPQCAADLVMAWPSEFRMMQPGFQCGQTVFGACLINHRVDLAGDGKHKQRHYGRCVTA